MKKHLYLLSFLIAPSIVLAQPTITTMNNFSVGDHFKRVNVDPTNVTPGTPGANQHWNFGSLSVVDTTFIDIISPSATSYASQFSGASFALKDDVGSYEFYSKTSSNNYMLGKVDSTSNFSLDYTANSMLTAQRPISYTNSVTDTFLNSATQSPLSLNGGGTISVTADGWGTLHLPDKAYDSVLRIKAIVIQNDSTLLPFPTSLSINRVMYFYYSNAFTAPLLVWDSTTVGGVVDDTSKSVSYLVDPTLSTKNIAANAAAFTGSLHGSALLLKGQFENGTAYQVDVMNLEGQKIFSSAFTANKESQSFDLHKEISSGIYLVSVRKANDINSIRVLKLVKE